MRLLLGGAYFWEGAYYRGLISSLQQMRLLLGGAYYRGALIIGSLRYFISVSFNFTLLNSSCLNLGIGLLVNDESLGWAIMFARMFVSFNPFCECICASILSDMIWMKQLHDYTSTLLLSHSPRLQIL